jgi:hypothetical protein
MSKWQELEAPFPFSEIEVKVQSLSRNGDKGLAIAYFDARAVRRRLNAVLGRGGWKPEYRPDGKGVICRLTVVIEGEQYSFEDGADYTDIASYKGGVSDSFKRAFAGLCNDSLYSTALGWQPCETYDGNNGKKQFSNWTAEALNTMERLYRKQVGIKADTSPVKAKERKGEPDENAPFGWWMRPYDIPDGTKQPSDKQFTYFKELCAQFGITESVSFRSFVCRAYGVPPDHISKFGGHVFGIEFLKDAHPDCVQRAIDEMNAAIAAKNSGPPLEGKGLAETVKEIFQTV